MAGVVSGVAAVHGRHDVLRGVVSCVNKVVLYEAGVIFCVCVAGAVSVVAGLAFCVVGVAFCVAGAAFCVAGVVFCVASVAFCMAGVVFCAIQEARIARTVHVQSPSHFPYSPRYISR